MTIAEPKPTSTTTPLVPTPFPQRRKTAVSVIAAAAIVAIIGDAGGPGVGRDDRSRQRDRRLPAQSVSSSRWN